MPILIIIIVLIGIIFFPQWWAKRTFEKYAKKQDHIPGSGGELARHILDQHGMQNVKVEITDAGDHYSPDDKVVRLSESNFNDNSLTAVAVAAHEVGHAIQDHKNESKLALRSMLVVLVQKTTGISSVVMMIMPIVLIVSRSPMAIVVFLLAGLLSIAGPTIVHLVTLPVEWDASFGKALPILKADYIRKEDVPAVEQILKAAALTYVAASLMSIINIWRWLALFRR